MPSTKKTLVSLLLVAVVASTALVAGPTATASADTFNRSSAYLRVPSDVWEPTACVQRSIWLRSGTYRWRMYTRFWASDAPAYNKGRYIWLAEGWYTWRDCLSDASAPTPQGGRGYDQATRLNGARISTFISPKRTGTYTYGSALLRTGR